jgi:hypothetical protein
LPNPTRSSLARGVSRGPSADARKNAVAVLTSNVAVCIGEKPWTGSDSGRDPRPRGRRDVLRRHVDDEFTDVVYVDFPVKSDYKDLFTGDRARDFVSTRVGINYGRASVCVVLRVGAGGGGRTHTPVKGTGF